MAYDTVNAPSMSTPMADTMTPHALSELAIAAERASSTAQALLVARHAHNDANKQLQEALEHLEKTREQEGV